MSKVVSVEARTVHITLRQATAFARRQVTARDYTLVKVRTVDGLEGIGHCYAGHSGWKCGDDGSPPDVGTDVDWC